MIKTGLRTCVSKSKMYAYFRTLSNKNLFFPPLTPHDSLFLKIKTNKRYLFPKSWSHSSAQLTDFFPPDSLSFPANEKKKKDAGFPLTLTLSFSRVVVFDFNSFFLGC